jgi:hypothetical protein
LTTRRFDDLGFTPAYACEVDPEFPGTGDWGDPHSSLAALGRSGLAWESQQLYWLSLRVEAAGLHGLRCVGYSFGGELEEFTVDPRTGSRRQDT